MSNKSCRMVKKNNQLQISVRMRGSFTVEGTVIVGMICIITGMMIMLGMYCHDRVIIRQAADKAAVDGAMWCGNYVSPELKEVDYERLKKMTVLEANDSASVTESYLKSALLLGQIESVSVVKTMLGQQVTAEVTVHFSYAGRDVTVTEYGKAAVLGSLQFKRKSTKTEESE